MKNKANVKKTVRKLPLGVQDLKNGRFRVRLTHPMLKVRVCLGTFGTLDEATTAIQNKRAEFHKEFGSKKKPFIRSPKILIENKRVEFDKEFGCKEPLMLRPNHNEIRRPMDDDGVEFVIGLAAKEKGNDGFNHNEIRSPMDDDTVEFVIGLAVKEKGNDEFRELPDGVRPTKTGRWGAWFKDPVSGIECQLSSYKTVEEAAIAVQKTRAKVHKRRTQINIDDRVVDKYPTKPECGNDLVDCPNSVFEAESSGEKLFDSSKKSANTDYGDQIVEYNQKKHECGFGHIGSPTLVIEAEKSSNEPVSTSASFDEWLKVGIINQYGEFLGEYRKLDDVLWFDNHCENEATIRSTSTTSL